MSKKKSKSRASTSGRSQQAKPASSPTKNNKPLMLAAGLVAVLILGIVIVSGGSGGNGSPSGLVADPAEAQYLGRYLPAGYTAPRVEGVGPLTATAPMVQITAEQTETSFTVPVSDLTANRIVGFSYLKPGSSQPIAMVAYVKPSGAVFVGVSYCAPCKGTTHALTTDGALTCDACGTKRDAETEIGISGSCRLYPLDEIPASIVGDSIVIDTQILDTWIEQPLDRQVG